MNTPLFTSQWLVFAVYFLACAIFVPRFVKGQTQFRQAVNQTLANIACGMGFAVYIAISQGTTDAALYLTGFIIEKALSMDNLFVIGQIFSVLAIEVAMQHRLLQLGILGAMVFRGIFIGLGAMVIAQWGWLLYGLGLGLVILGGKIFWPHLQFMQRLAIIVARLFPATRLFLFCLLIHFYLREESGEKYEEPWALRTAKRFGWPVFGVALFAVEVTDIIFAIDSVPAILGITQDVFLVFTSNMFALLGLRSLYFCLQSVQADYKYLEPTLGGILTFIGVKALLPLFGVHFPTLLSLGIVITAITLAILLSPKPEPATEELEVA